MNGSCPTSTSEPPERFLGAVEKKDSCSGKTKDQRTCIPRRVEEVVDGIVRHGAAH